MYQFQNLHYLNAHSSCRTCLENLNDMHHDIFAIPFLQEKIVACTSLPVEPGDGYPTSLCEKCHTKIDDFFDFQQMCSSARKRFQDYINSEKKPFVMELVIDPVSLPKDLMVLKKETTGEQENSLTYDACSEFVEMEIQNVKIQEDFAAEEESDDDEPIIKYRVRNEENCFNDHSPFSENKDTTEDVKHETVIHLECKICNKIFKETEAYTAHMLAHQSLKLFSCQLCEKSYSKRFLLEDHIRAKHEASPDKFKCFKQTSRKLTQNLHSGIRTTRKQHRSYICEECGKVLSSMTTLKNHLYLHTGAQLPHECPQCQKRYITKHKLKDHMDIRHAGIKKYTCPHCDAKKSTRGELTAHINYHTKEKSYPCKVCDVVFLSDAGFRRHMRFVHQGVRAYPCSYCDKSFGMIRDRKFHELTHTGEKPYECNTCNKKFNQPSALNRHKKIHTGEKPHECNICHKTFIQSGDLKKHKATHFKNKKNKVNKNIKK